MKHTQMQQIGLERIYRLFELAEQELKKHPERSKRYIGIAIEIGKKTRARFPSELKTKYCKKCNAFLNRTNSEIIKAGTLQTIKCKECGFERKIKN
ncbi:MAG: ribonuclease P [Candidatus Diapherotrites archaeon]|uniref:Ribonuclease P n=1 Tax=Candidatus Iainarchaeum sp. TaxID=3101447 RepID=A0A2D6LQ44_9ARCH|nr:ribonuclease P [Candidatus Diapherotrites archaeon]|tara:strand:- start:26934 stop:27221 length:288 start_codon:yes stop_codon:yes gene_type:complete